jgi:hypothetical protein
MRKLFLAAAALGAIGIALPVAANAETVVIKKHRPIYNEVVPPPPPHVVVRPHDSKTVIIKHNDD